MWGSLGGMFVWWWWGGFIQYVIVGTVQGSSPIGYDGTSALILPHKVGFKCWFWFDEREGLHPKTAAPSSSRVVSFFHHHICNLTVDGLRSSVFFNRPPTNSFFFRPITFAPYTKVAFTHTPSYLFLFPFYLVARLSYDTNRHFLVAAVAYPGEPAYLRNVWLPKV